MTVLASSQQPAPVPSHLYPTTLQAGRKSHGERGVIGGLAAGHPKVPGRNAADGPHPYVRSTLTQQEVNDALH